MIQTDNGPTKLTYAAFKDRKKRREVTHAVVTDDDAVTAYRAADEALTKGRARNLPAKAIAALEQARDDAEAAVRDATLLFKLRALPREGENSYAALKAEHPPTKADNEKVADATGDPKAKALWHTDTFGPAVVAACLVEPEVTVEQAREMSQDMNDAEWDALVMAAIRVNQQATDTAGLVFS